MDKDFDIEEELASESGEDADADNGESGEDGGCRCEEYYALPGGKGRRSLVFSLLSLVSALLSVFLFVLYLPSIIFALIAVALAIVARRRLGYFDRLSLVGLTIAIFGFVFAVGAGILDSLGALDTLFR